MADSDPIPGDPDRVAALGRELRRTADELSRQIRNLKAVAEVDAWDSDAGREFREKAKEAYKVGGLQLYLSTLSIGQLPLASSLLVSMPPPGTWPTSATVPDLVNHMSEGGRDVRAVELPAAGFAAREYRKQKASPQTQMGNSLPTTTVIYHVPVPASRHWLTLAFSTPIDPLAEQMAKLFDVVAGTLHWTH